MLYVDIKTHVRIYFLQVITNPSKEAQNVTRQAYAGLLWSKQFFHYIVKDWLDGDRDQPPAPQSRKYGRNADWNHLFNKDVVSMPDKWEYPWVSINANILELSIGYGTWPPIG